MKAQLKEKVTKVLELFYKDWEAYELQDHNASVSDDPEIWKAGYQAYNEAHQALLAGLAEINISEKELTAIYNTWADKTNSHKRVRLFKNLVYIAATLKQSDPQADILKILF